MKKFSFLRKEKTVLILFSFFLLLFSFSLVSALDVSQGSQLDDVTGVNIIIPEAPINYSLVPTVNSSDFWDNLDTPLDISAGDLKDGDFGNKNITTTKDIFWDGGSSLNANAAYAHISSTGASHSYINQAVTTSSNPTFSTVSASAFYGLALVLGDGTASTPSLLFLNDPNTGIGRKGNDNIRFLTGGVERADISNTTFTIQTDLDVIGTGAFADVTVDSHFTGEFIKLTQSAGGYYLEIYGDNALNTDHRRLDIDVADGYRLLTIQGNPTLDDWFDQSVKTTADPYFNTLATRLTLSSGGNIIVAGDIRHSGDADTKLGFHIDNLDIIVGNYHFLRFIELPVPLQDITIFNEEGLDIDTRIEGENDLNLFYTEASTDRIGIGTLNPTHKLNVVGDVNITGTLINPAIYCESSELNDQTFTVAGARYRLNISNIDEGNGISMSTGNNGTNITIEVSGVYHLVAQPQVKAGAGGAGDFHMWIEKFSSGSWADISDSNIELKLSSLEEDVIVLATTLKLNQGEKLRLVVSVSDNKILLHAQSPAGEPIIPSIIFTMYRIGS